MAINIIGAGGFAREVAWLLESLNIHKSDIRYYAETGIKEGVYNLDSIRQEKNDPSVIAIGSPGTRKRLATLLYEKGITYLPFISYGLDCIGSRSTLGQGTIICQGSIITCDVTLGEFVIVNLNCTIGHDCKIGNYVTLAPGCNISGNVNIEDEVELGTNVSVIPGVTIGKGAIVGAGSVIIKDVPPYSLVVGNPGRLVRFLSEQPVS